jgi:hypothetical protein
MGRSSEAGSNLTLPARNRRLQQERLGGYAPLATIFGTHPATVVAACWLHPTVPIAMRDILRVG